MLLSTQPENHMNLGWQNQIRNLVRQTVEPALAEDLEVSDFEQGLMALVELQRQVAALKVEQIWPYFRPKA